MPSITGKVVAWTKGPPRGFTVKDERTGSVQTVEITDGVDAEDLAIAVTAKGDGQRVTVDFTNHPGPPAYNSLDAIRSAP